MIYSSINKANFMHTLLFRLYSPWAGETDSDPTFYAGAAVTELGMRHKFIFDNCILVSLAPITIIELWAELHHNARSRVGFATCVYAHT